ncbi:equilibrative nucleoside transporter 1 isoform x1 [Plasmopara halstedii]|uniref:Equilibrative nucleoside transporter 1 isoform x1 n=1 Tax=Plasmopara halstedii TaxID=4781 RepID=A0A0P1B0J2_PLAHL|nr:equilibrative nucleoside transporter 1 isoform x1 [Plasmopara halstedii]CEG47694.1 equilibrative nucleoside transporter 1 isoform x1 [Plasmopara halstedii]|eukprot:XP_024584063.1 equilibrative nucleoside transporter 1 isoform x1 [Plasmopara halstedii]
MEHISGVMFAIFFFIGVGSSLPWNVFITAQDYFQHRLEGTAYEDSFLNWFSMAFNVSTLMTMLVRTIVLAERMASAIRTVFFSLIVIMIIMFMHCTWTRTPEFHGYPFFHTTVVSILLVACASTLMQEGLLRIVSTFPPQYTQAVVSGQSFAGLAVSLSNFIILWADEAFARRFDALHASPDLCALLYFVLVFITLVLCLLTFAILTRMSLFRCYSSPDCQEKYINDVPSETDTMDSIDTSPRIPLLDKESGGSELSNKVDVMEVAFTIRFYAAATFFVFIVTLGVFPGITSAIKSMEPKRDLWSNKLFTPFTLILFNISDFIARLSASWWPRLGQKNVFLASIARIIFFPLLMLCNLRNKSDTVITTVIFRSDVLAMLFIAACAFSNGLLCTLAFMEYPDLFRKPAEKEIGGSIIFFVLSIGLTAGSIMSFVLKAMLKQ